ncbi:MAG: hypothetical protein ACOCQY_02380 [Halorhabdus sp.]
MSLQSLAYTCRVCRGSRIVTVDDATPYPRVVHRYCRTCNARRAFALGQRHDARERTVAEGSA